MGARRLPGILSRAFVAALTLIVVAALAAPAFAAGRRVALVIGQAAYESLPRLENTTNDAEAVKGAMQKAGFEVYFGVDLKRVPFEDLLKRFYRAADGAEIALLYYSGHGVQVGGANYIVPVDAQLATAYDIELQTINVDDIFEYLNAHTSAQLIFLDACRTNPFRIQKYWIADTLKPIGQTTGLARSAANIGTLIAFSTEPGKIAYDGTGPTSPYTTAFVRHIATPNQEIRQALTQIRRDVIAATGGRQVPWENSSLAEDLYLVRAPSPPAVPPMVRIDAPDPTRPIPLHLPEPLAETGGPLKVQIDHLPEQGRLLLNGKPLDKTAALTGADLDKLSYDPAGAPRGAVGLMSYVVSDSYNQATRGVVAITIGAEKSPDALEQREARRSAAAQAVEAYFKSLDHFAATPPVGVGPTPLGLAGAPAEAAEIGAQVAVAATPQDGALLLGQRTLTPGARMALADLPKLAFEPKVGADSHSDAISLKSLFEPQVQIALSVTPKLDACDSAAAAPLDLQGVAPGKAPNEIDAPAAIAACKRALEAHPGVARFAYQLGRAQLAAGLADEARRSFQEADDKKHMRAVAALGDMALFGVFGAADPAKADAYYKACAAGGDAYCLHSYGKALFYGQGVAKDVSRGLKLMIRAAELGHTYAMNELGYIFTYGRNVPVDVERGIRYYEAGAARGDIYSYNNLGLVYLRGKGRPVDYAKARDYFLKASDGGQPYAPTNIGVMYRDGDGVPADLDAAAKWLELGAKRGDYWGALYRARLNADRPGAAVDAAIWLARAAALDVDRGNADPDHQARRMLAKLGEADKRQALARLEAELGPDESAKVTARALDDRLAEVSNRLWRRNKPRYDLF
ncbi:MAG TPA: caspase family protein [Roseiarcus sp.]|nr:caspase family protein [Roseiarcus sp.]